MWHVLLAILYKLSTLLALLTYLACSLNYGVLFSVNFVMFIICLVNCLKCLTDGHIWLGSFIPCVGERASIFVSWPRESLHQCQQSGETHLGWRNDSVAWENWLWPGAVWHSTNDEALLHAIHDRRPALQDAGEGYPTANRRWQNC